jgi:hypothetical protein
VEAEIGSINESGMEDVFARPSAGIRNKETREKEIEKDGESKRKEEESRARDLQLEEDMEQYVGILVRQEERNEMIDRQMEEDLYGDATLIDNIMKEYWKVSWMQKFNPITMKEPRDPTKEELEKYSQEQREKEWEEHFEQA